MSDSEKRSKKIEERKRQREAALGFVFESMFRDDGADEAFLDAAGARDEEIGDYTRSLVTGIEKNLTQIDSLIEANLKGWKKNRISKVSLTILRISVYELLFVEDVPTSVSINEAVELAKTYAGEGDGAFVNGVLGGVANTLEKGDK